MRCRLRTRRNESRTECRGIELFRCKKRPCGISPVCQRCGRRTARSEDSMEGSPRDLRADPSLRDAYLGRAQERSKVNAG